MKHPTIRIEGAILSGDILEKIENAEIKGQKPSDFNLGDKAKSVKDEIVTAWADAQDLWRIFQRRIENLPKNQTGTSETRNQWIVPLLGLLGYRLEYQHKGEVVNDKNYAISHRDISRDLFPVHIMGLRDSLDKKRQDSGPRMSPHALVQEYLNLTEHLYAIVTNGLQLRLLRDSTRLVKLSYLEFNLEQMMEEGIYADFAILYRILHASRMPLSQDTCPESLIEQYHQDSLESGSRIRDGLSKAVEKCIVAFANGFINHPDNDNLRDDYNNGHIDAHSFYQFQLRLIYRLLFLMVIEERDLVFPSGTDLRKRQIYYSYYSVARLRKLSERRYLADARYKDLWISLRHTFRLFEEDDFGKPLDIKPLAGDLFSPLILNGLNIASLDNKVLLGCISSLSTFVNPDNGQKMRVNYAALNVEEFGSVYEGLLEYDPVMSQNNGRQQFSLVKGKERSSSGTHYTPDELVTPLIKYSLEYVIEDKLQKARELHKQNPKQDLNALKEQKLLSITVCDVACGSGHILLNAARRIATELACVRTDEDQPSPLAFRTAVRDVIRHCIFGVDINPLAVELCKVALWLEAHNPNEPLNFLDHHIKCGNAIVGLAHQEELERGIPEEAFKRLPADDKDICKSFRDRNKQERKERKQKTFDFEKNVGKNLSTFIERFNTVLAMPEKTPHEIEAKQSAYRDLQNSPEIHDLRTISDIQIAQFFIPKTEDNEPKIITDEQYWHYLEGRHAMQGQAVGKAMAMAVEKRFFHWFLEFPKVFANGGFDCILGNPPYLGGQALSGTFGNNFCEYTRYEFTPAKGCDLVAFFIRRNFQIIPPNRFNAIITTNSVKDGKTREAGLDVIVERKGNLNFVVRSIKWPGTANLFVSLLGIVKGKWDKDRLLDNQPVDYISTYFEDYENIGEPFALDQNKNQMYQGFIFLGEGFLLSYEEREKLVSSDPKNSEVIFPGTNGDEVNNDPEQRAGRCVINFFDWPEEEAQKYPEIYNILLEKVKPVRDRVKRKSNRENWWIYAENRPGLRRGLQKVDRCFVVAATTKHLNFSLSPTDRVFTHALFVYVNEKFSKIAVLQSSIHNEWARKYSGALKQDLRYSPSNCFVTFPFPQNLSQGMENTLEKTGEECHEFRRQLMLKMQLGLTKTYNQFHNPDLRELADEDLAQLASLSARDSQKQYGKETLNLYKHLSKTEGVCSFNEAVRDILHLRELHKQMDELVLQAYGWHETSDYGPAVDLKHDFYEVDYLPENDRIRYTISPEARKEILKRLLKLNHEIHEQEVQEAQGKKKSGKRKRIEDLPLLEPQ